MVEQEALAVSDRSRLRRKRERGSYDRTVIDAILDEGLVCHVGYVLEGTPFVVPTAYARVGDVVYLHGAPANQMLAALAAGCPACLTVTLLDGLVLSRAAMHHSMNFRSVMLFGTAAPVHDPEDKRVAVTAVVEHVVPGRSSDAREPSPQELRKTAVVAFPIVEGSAKVRAGGPIEEASDLSLPVWAGQVPLRMTVGAPVPDADLLAGVTEPDYLRRRPDLFTGERG